ncbi:MAG: MFS transporter, partial [Planctomycetota bacterium]
MSVPETTVNRFNRAAIVDRNFVALLENWRESLRAQRDPDEALEEAGGLSGRDLIELLESQMIARHQDLASRQMRARGTGFYTIGSTGHEGNALLGRFTRPTDLAFLHYRSGAFLAERARQVPGQDFIRDTML